MKNNKVSRIMLLVANLHGGGQERIAALTANMLSDHYDVTLVTFRNDNEKYYVSEKVNRVNLNIPDSANALKRVVNVLKRTWRIRGLKKRIGIDCCISYGNSSNIVNAMSAGKEKTILSVRNVSEFETGRNPVNSYMFKKSDAIYCISNGQRLKIIKNYNKYTDKILTIHNPCDIDDVEKKRSYDERKENNLVCCGRLEAVKCYKNLINSIAIVKEKHTDITLTIIGSGSQEKELKEFVKEKGYIAWVRFLPFTDNPFDIISRSRLFVYASCSEGFGNVIVEALACETPVVSTDCDYGPREILSDTRTEMVDNEICKSEYGVLTPVFKCNIDEQKELEKVFAKAVNLLLEDRVLYEHYRSHSKERSRKFSVDSFRIQVEKMLSEV